MLQKQVFGQNLAALCKAYKNIAEVSREIGINRSQFNRYLNGSAIPSDRNIQKIAEFFQVTPTSLFQQPSEDGYAKKKGGHPIELAKFGFELIDTETPSALQPGLYFTTFSIPSDPKTVIRSATIVKVMGNVTIFRRLTAFGEPDHAWWSHFGGDHSGLVFDRRQHLHFMGINRNGCGEPSLITAAWTNSQRPLLVGHAAILGPSSPIVAPVVISACPPHMKLTSALRRSHAYAIDDPEIETFVVDMLSEKGAELANMLRPLDLNVYPIK